MNPSSRALDMAQRIHYLAQVAFRTNITRPLKRMLTQIQTRSAETAQHLVELSPNLAQIGPISADSGRSRSNYGRNRSGSGRSLVPECGSRRPQSWSIGRFGPLSAKVGPASAEFPADVGRFGPAAGEHRPASPDPAGASFANASRPTRRAKSKAGVHCIPAASRRTAYASHTCSNQTPGQELPFRYDMVIPAMESDESVHSVSRDAAELCLGPPTHIGFSGGQIFGGVCLLCCP